MTNLDDRDIYQMIKEGSFSAVVQRMKEKNSKEMNTENLTKKRVRKSFVRGMLISCKTSKPDSKALKNQKGFKGYHTLFLLREVRTGDNFYLISATCRETEELVKKSHLNYLGEILIVYEPTSNSEIFHTCRVEEAPGTSLIPIQRDVNGMVLSPPGALDLKENVTIYTFLFKVDKLEIGSCRMTLSCSYDFCDASHRSTDHCPKLGMKMGYDYRTLTTDVEVEGTSVLYSSKSFTELFCHVDMTNDRVNLPCRDLEDSVYEQLEEYERANIPWYIAGWFKRIITGENEGSYKGPLHITTCFPARILRTRKFLSHRNPTENIEDYRINPNVIERVVEGEEVMNLQQNERVRVENESESEAEAAATEEEEEEENDNNSSSSNNNMSSSDDDEEKDMEGDSTSEEEIGGSPSKRRRNV